MLTLAKKKLPRLSESVCINAVAEAYKQALRVRFNRQFFPLIKPHSKTAENCVKFVIMSQEVGRSPRRLLDEAFAFFDPEFCMRVCKTEYPQITFLISEKTQNRLRLQNRPTIKVTSKNIEALADQYMDVLTVMDKQMAIDAIKGGWPADAPEVRKELLRRLRAKD